MNQKIAIFGIVIASVLSVGTALALSNSGGGEWSYCEEIMIKENSGLSLTNYQVLLELTPSDFPNEAKSDGSDIRFTKDGIELDYWIEDYNAVAQTAKIWIKVPEIPANGIVQLLMYYGNQNAVAVSNGEATFDLYDNFEDGNYNGWNVQGGTWNVENGELSQSSYNRRTFIGYGDESWDNYVFNAKVKLLSFSEEALFLIRVQDSTYNHYEIALRGRNNDDTFMEAERGPTGDHTIWEPPWPLVFTGPLGFDTQQQQWYNIQIVAFENNFKYFIDNSLIFDVFDGYEDYFQAGGIGFSSYCTHVHFDDIIVRKYTYPEPTVEVNHPPIADANGPSTGSEGSTITFDGTGSYDPDGTIVNYEWDFGDGETATGTTPTHAYGDNGIYTVTLTVTDDDGGETIDTLTVTVNNVAPTASIDSIEQPNAYFILPYHELKFFGSFTDPGWLDTHTIVWDFGDGETATGTLTPTHAYGDNGIYHVTLTVTDDDGDIGTDNIEITILSEEEAITTVDDYIQDLPDDAFNINPDQRENALSEKLDEVNGLIEAEKYQEAIEKLQDDIRGKADGYVDGNPVNDWITDPDEQQELCMMIDDLIAYLETLL